MLNIKIVDFELYYEKGNEPVCEGHANIIVNNTYNLNVFLPLGMPNEKKSILELLDQHVINKGDIINTDIKMCVFFSYPIHNKQEHYDLLDDIPNGTNYLIYGKIIDNNIVYCGFNIIIPNSKIKCFNLNVGDVFSSTE